MIYPPVLIGGYLLGSIPFGWLVARARGVDIQRAGSGNIGATNAMRVLGKPAGILVLALDLLKGLAAALGVPMLAAHGWAAAAAPVPVSLALLAGVGAVLGHNYPCWLKFKGGKGVATTAGVYLALAPWALLIAAGVFVVVVAATRYVSAGSVAAAVALPLAVWLRPPVDPALGVITIALGLLAIFKHRSNLRRLRAGTENRLGQKAGGGR